MTLLGASNNDSYGPPIVLPPVYVDSSSGRDLGNAAYWAGLNQLLGLLSPRTPGYYLARGPNSTGSKIIAGAVTAQTAVDISGVARKSTVGSNLKIYPSGWRGNQYVTTVKIAEILAKVGLGLAFGATVWDWYHVTTGDVSATHASVNTVVTVLGLRADPMGASFATTYVLVDNFYPGGWIGGESGQFYNGAGALRDVGTTTEQNQKIIPDWRMRDPGGF